ncbi:YceI family protein [Psychroserpens algicola]|uniref:YceI family protein n=1 Tax=Psychroserpens algicola TaxID=1719034 RepID=A0ABT0HBH4_9FLAO|nr:YceI family protein [Psychroserpens algicola]MCK8481389.1 YceI family protein [Psychroserpens algicola]
MKLKVQLLVCIFTICLMATTNAQEKLQISTAKSEIKWSGEYTFYFGGHNGTISFSEGYFEKTNEVITGGEFIIDMNSIVCDDIDTKDANESLVNHLKDPDFFDVDKFPKATLQITSVEYYDNAQMKIYANLIIKGITKPISFNAEVDYESQQMTTKFKIDRMLWDISYNSKMRDGAISDAIGFEVKLSL